MKARSLQSQKSSFFNGKLPIPTIGGKGDKSKEAIRRAVNPNATPSSRPTLRKRIATATKMGFGALAIATALNLVNKSVTRAGLDRLAMESDLKAKTTMVEKANAPKYTNRYPKVSPIDASREMKEVAKILKLNLKEGSMNYLVDSKIADAIFEVAQKAGVSPRVALRTLARSSGKASSLNEKASMQRQRVRELEAAGEFKIANQANMELQKIEKIQEILNQRDKLNPETRSLMMKRIDSAGSFNVNR